MPNLRKGTKGGFEPGLSRLQVQHSTGELPRSMDLKSNQLIVENCMYVSVAPLLYMYG